MPSACDQASAPVTAGGSGYGWHSADTACSLDCFSAHHDGTALLAGSKAGPLLEIRLSTDRPTLPCRCRYHRTDTASIVYCLSAAH